MENIDFGRILINKHKEYYKQIEEIKERIKSGERLTLDDDKLIEYTKVFPHLISVDEYSLYDGGSIGIFGYRDSYGTQRADTIDNYASGERQGCFKRALEKYYNNEIRDMKIKEWEKRELENIEQWREMVKRGHRLPYVPRDYSKLVQEAIEVLAVRMTLLPNIELDTNEVSLCVHTVLLYPSNQFRSELIYHHKLLELVDKQLSAMRLRYYIEDPHQDVYGSDGYTTLLADRIELDKSNSRILRETKKLINWENLLNYWDSTLLEMGVDINEK